MLPNGRDIIREGYRLGDPVAEIALRAGSTPGSVKVIAGKMGLAHPSGAPGRSLTGQKARDYRHLVHVKGFRAWEALRIVGGAP